MNDDYRIVAESCHQLHYERIGYTYQILETDRQEILAYHWHPIGFSGVMHPHFHLPNRFPPIIAGRGQREIVLSDMHIPTGFVTFADIVRLLIDEFGVEPLRDDWRAVLAAGEDV
jgi:hypothetical protein